MNLFQEAKSILDKDGKVNPLGPYGKSKLTGRETSTYFRRNKVKDANIKKAVEVALDLGGAYDIASKEIKKFYGDKVLRSKEVQQALSYANEEVQEAVSPAQQAAIAISKKEKGEKPKNEDAEAKAKLNLKHTQDMEKLKAKQAREKEAISENYRKLAKYGMGTETSKSARVGLELDFYDEKGNKQFGKILQRTNTGYLVQDDKGKKHVLKYHDRKLAKKMLKPNYIHTEEFDNVDKAKKNPYKALGFSQHPHKGFEGERMPKGMRDFRTKALTPTQIKKQMNVMDSYRAMWEDGEKYAPVDENVERGIMKKMRKGRVAKGMPR